MEGGFSAQHDLACHRRARVTSQNDAFDQKNVVTGALCNYHMHWAKYFAPKYSSKCFSWELRNTSQQPAWFYMISVLFFKSFQPIYSSLLFFNCSSQKLHKTQNKSFWAKPISFKFPGKSLSFQVCPPKFPDKITGEGAKYVLPLGV